jgi:hypothetical protein
MTDNPLFRSPRNLVITGADLDDDTFSGEFGGRYLTYNVSKAMRDCLAGKHGHKWIMGVAPAYKANKKVEVENAKVRRFMDLSFTTDIFDHPLICVIEDGAAWLIDGHHRLRAMDRIGVAEFFTYVIEEANREQYLVLFNGKPEMPEELRHPDIIGKAGLS